MSAQRFEVGEVAICYCPGEDNHGKEATVLSPLATRKICDFNGKRWLADAYIVRVDSELLGAEPHQLRKKLPPRDDLEVVRWADVPGGDVIARPAKVLA